MSDAAVAWIQRGVLLDAMPEVAVAFGLATLQHTPSERRVDGHLELLVEHALIHSGISVGAKLEKLEAPLRTEDRAGAERCYDAHMDAVSPVVSYFPGALELVRDLNSAGAVQYITSASPQHTLDVWGYSLQGRQVSEHLTLLGSTKGFQKGRHHFEEMRRAGARAIYFVADARREIVLGKECAAQGVVPIGYAHVITPERLQVAYERVRSANAAFLNQSIDGVPFDPVRMHLPDRAALRRDLETAGAEFVVEGSPQFLMPKLRLYFRDKGLLN